MRQPPALVSGVLAGIGSACIVIASIDEKSMNPWVVLAAASLGASSGFLLALSARKP